MALSCCVRLVRLKPPEPSSGMLPDIFLCDNSMPTPVAALAPESSLASEGLPSMTPLALLKVIETTFSALEPVSLSVFSV